MTTSDVPPGKFTVLLEPCTKDRRLSRKELFLTIGTLKKSGKKGYHFKHLSCIFERKILKIYE